MRSHIFDKAILREYDIRGIFGDNLHCDDALALGYILASLSFERDFGTVCVGRDGRHSSPALYDELCRGLSEGGMRVLAIGECATPELYFASYYCESMVAVMVTGSHNPGEHNGFKIIFGGEPFFGESISGLYDLGEGGNWGSRSGGVIESCDIRGAYIARLLEEFSDLVGMRIAFDPGNGALSLALESLLPHLSGEFRVINGFSDGSFPGHHPDPTVIENLAELRSVVVEGGYDFGVAFDGDGDRVGVIDDKGEVLWGDNLLPLYAEDILSRHEGASIIGDIKTSSSVFSAIVGMGGDAIMSATGHSIIKRRMVETGALLAVEMSGHIFFADSYYGYDDGLYASLRLWRLLGSSGRKLSDLRLSYPCDVATPEVRLPILAERKFAIICEMRDYVIERYGEDGVILIDGLRVSCGVEGSWFLVRAANTENVLSMRAAGMDSAGLSVAVSELRDLLEFFDISDDGLLSI